LFLTLAIYTTEGIKSITITIKYADLLQSHLFQPTAVETSGSMGTATATFFTHLGCKISSVSGEVREASFLFQCISVSVQRLNLVLLHNSFAPTYGFED